MFYRRKILLALLEVCGGRLSRTDMEKLLFGYCRERGVNYYDFFPYRFGCFSFLSYQDKRILTQQGYLSDDDDFVLNSRKSFFAALEIPDKQCLRDFAQRTKHLRGNALVRHIYLQHPYYACRSEIRDRVLTRAEQALVDSTTAKQESNCLFTVGYEGLTIDAYIDKLIRHSVSIVIDVRRNAISMKYGFSKTRFQKYLDRAGIAYEHIPSLGVASAERKNLQTADDYHSLFEKYARTLPHFSEELARICRLLNRYGRAALTCFEYEATSCHRHKITEHLQSSEDWDIPIVHIAKCLG
jgi:uncharacterized protein (DUF488 family)